MCKGVARDSEIIYWKVVRTYVTPHFTCTVLSGFNMYSGNIIWTVFSVIYISLRSFSSLFIELNSDHILSS
jgi:hypothetical protein